LCCCRVSRQSETVGTGGSGGGGGGGEASANGEHDSDEEVDSASASASSASTSSSSHASSHSSVLPPRDSMHFRRRRRWLCLVGQPSFLDSDCLTLHTIHCKYLFMRVCGVGVGWRGEVLWGESWLYDKYVGEWAFGLST